MNSVAVLPAVYTWRSNSVRPVENLPNSCTQRRGMQVAIKGACRRASHGSAAIRADRGCVVTLALARAPFNPLKTHR